MWVEEKPGWLRTIVFGGVALPKIWGRSLFVAFLSLIVTIGYERVPFFHHSLTFAPFTILGLPLSIFLGFRNSAAYERFWEGRKIWGQIVNTSRSLTRQILTLLDGEATPHVHLQIAWVHALRHHLRNEDPGPMLERLAPKLDLSGEPNIPIAILFRLGEGLAKEMRAGKIDRLQYGMIENSLISLTDEQGKAERIKSTPVPYSYAVLIHRIVAIYCVLLPLGLFDTTEWATPVVVLVISYIFFGLDAVGDELEQPFGLETNDLPIEAISTAIESNARARIGEPLPPAITPKKGVLS